MKKLLTLSLATLLLSSTAVMAQDQQLFDSLDSDGNDKLSFTDLKAYYPDLTQEAFDAADLDTDDFLDITQFGALQSSMTSASTTEVAAMGTVGDSGIDLPNFDLVDLDSNDKVSIDDLTGLGITQEQFDAADLDNDDFLDRSQYEALKTTMGVQAPNVAVGMAQPMGDKPTFELIDTDGDGQLDFSTLKAAWPDLTQEQFDAADVDNDDFLDKTQYESLS